MPNFYMLPKVIGQAQDGTRYSLEQMLAMTIPAVDTEMSVREAAMQRAAVEKAKRLGHPVEEKVAVVVDQKRFVRIPDSDDLRDIKTSRTVYAWSDAKDTPKPKLNPLIGLSRIVRSMAVHSQPGQV